MKLEQFAKQLAEATAMIVKAMPSAKDFYKEKPMSLQEKYDEIDGMDQGKCNYGLGINFRSLFGLDPSGSDNPYTDVEIKNRLLRRFCEKHEFQWKVEFNTPNYYHVIIWTKAIDPLSSNAIAKFESSAPTESLAISRAILKAHAAFPESSTVVAWIESHKHKNCTRDSVTCKWLDDKCAKKRPTNCFAGFCESYEKPCSTDEEKLEALIKDVATWTDRANGKQNDTDCNTCELASNGKAKLEARSCPLMDRDCDGSTGVCVNGKFYKWFGNSTSENAKPILKHIYSAIAKLLPENKRNCIRSGMACIELDLHPTHSKCNSGWYYLSCCAHYQPPGPEVLVKEWTTKANWPIRIVKTDAGIELQTKEDGSKWSNHPSGLFVYAIQDKLIETIRELEELKQRDSDVVV